jgi:hypothetical protein
MKRTLQPKETNVYIILIVILNIVSPIVCEYEQDFDEKFLGKKYTIHGKEFWEIHKPSDGIEIQKECTVYGNPYDLTDDDRRQDYADKMGTQGEKDEEGCFKNGSPINELHKCCMQPEAMWDDGIYESNTWDLPHRLIDRKRKLVVASHVFCDPFSSLHSVLSNAQKLQLDDDYTILVDERSHRAACYRKVECAKSILMSTCYTGNDKWDYLSSSTSALFKYNHFYTTISNISNINILPLGYFQRFVGLTHPALGDPHVRVVFRVDKDGVCCEEVPVYVHDVPDESTFVIKDGYVREGFMAVHARRRLDTAYYIRDSWIKPNEVSKYGYRRIGQRLPAIPDEIDGKAVSFESPDKNSIGTYIEVLERDSWCRCGMLTLIVLYGSPYTPQFCTAIDVKTPGNSISGIKFYLGGCYGRLGLEQPAFRVPVKYSGTDVSDNILTSVINGDGVTTALFISDRDLEKYTLKDPGVIINVDGSIVTHIYHEYNEFEFKLSTLLYPSYNSKNLGVYHDVVALDFSGILATRELRVFFKQGNPDVEVISYQKPYNFTSLLIEGQEYERITVDNKEPKGLKAGITEIQFVMVFFISVFSIIVIIVQNIVCPVSFFRSIFSIVKKDKEKSD